MNSPGREPSFSFAVMGDPHPDPRQRSYIDPYTQTCHFRRALDEINRLDPDFLVMVGDLVYHASKNADEFARMWDGFEAAAAGLRMPHYRAIGSHDVCSARTQELYVARYGSRFPLYGSFDHGGCHFIILDSMLYTPEPQYPNIAGEQLSWLTRDLEHHDGRQHTFVFLHDPLWRTFSVSGPGKAIRSRLDPDFSNWLLQIHPLLVSAGVNTVFCGHGHDYVRDSTLDGVRYVRTAGAGSWLGELPELTGAFYHYLLVTVRGAAVSIAVIRTGAVECENIVTQDMVDRAADLEDALSPLASPSADEVHIVIPNPFEESLTGTLKWWVPAASPWRIKPTLMSLSVAPGEKQALVLPAPAEPRNPMPAMIWNLSLGGRSLWKDRMTVFADDDSRPGIDFVAVNNPDRRGLFPPRLAAERTRVGPAGAGRPLLVSGSDRELLLTVFGTGAAEESTVAFQSTDGGRTWDKAGTGIELPEDVPECIHRTPDGTLLRIDADGLFDSGDGGRSWTARPDFGQEHNDDPYLRTLNDGRLLYTFASCDAVTPQGFHAVISYHTDGQYWNFADDRLILAASPSEGEERIGRCGNTVELAEHTLLSCYTVACPDGRCFVESVRWHVGERRKGTVSTVPA